MNTGELLCYCRKVTAEDIRAAYDAGNTTLADIKKATGASTCCAGCTSKVRALLESFAN